MVVNIHVMIPGRCEIAVCYTGDNVYMEPSFIFRVEEIPPKHVNLSIIHSVYLIYQTICCHTPEDTNHNMGESNYKIFHGKETQHFIEGDERNLNNFKRLKLKRFML
jgi:hypothetical protein